MVRKPASPWVLLAFLPFASLACLIGAVRFHDPAYSDDHVSPARASAGHADLSGRAGGGSVFRIAGEWEFAWGRFDTVPPEGGRYAQLPGSWESAGVTERFGYATYGLTLEGLEPGGDYALCMGQTLSAWRLFVNDFEVGASGAPGMSAATESPWWSYSLTPFRAGTDGRARLALQVSNFRDRSGGSNSPLYVGPRLLVERMHYAQKALDATMCAILGVLGLFFLILYFPRRNDSFHAYFAAICLVVSFRALCYDGFVLLDLIPSIPWGAFFRAGYMTFPVVIVLFTCMVRSLFPPLFPRGVFIALIGPFVLYGGVILAAPTSVSAFLLPYAEFAALGTAAYGFAAIVRAAVTGMSGARWIVAGFAFAIASFVHDVLVSLWLISGASVSHIGLALCLFCVAFMAVRRYASSFDEVAALSARLGAVNRSLKRFAPEELLSYLRKDGIGSVQAGDAAVLDMAIMSADIRSFASIAERMAPAEVFAFLNEYLEMVSPIISQNKGFIAQYEGDGLIALFPSGSDSCLRAAVQIQSALAYRNRARADQRPLMVGIGIDAGGIVLGTLGLESRVDSAVISSCLQCASKIEAATKLFYSRILVNQSVFAGLMDPLAWFMRPVDRIEVGGRVSFLFEVYNNDTDTLRELKWRTQSDLEHALFAWFAGNMEEARRYLAKVLAVFPDDPVAAHYQRRLG